MDYDCFKRRKTVEIQLFFYTDCRSKTITAFLNPDSPPKHGIFSVWFFPKEIENTFSVFANNLIEAFIALKELGTAVETITFLKRVIVLPNLYSDLLVSLHQKHRKCFLFL